MTSEQQQSDLEAIFSALAVLGKADHATLELVLERRLDDDQLAQLLALPAVTKHGRFWVMAPDAASIRLKALEEHDFLHFRLLHQRAATILAQQVAAGDDAAEAAFMDIFTRLAEHLRHQDPTSVPALSAAVSQAPLKSRPNQHYRSYIEGISLQQSGQYDALRKLCNTLLMQPELDIVLRGRTHNLRATSFYFLGHLQPALDDYRAALAIMQQTGNRLSAGIVLQNMGALAYDLQEYTQAEELLRQAAVIFEVEDSAEWMAAVQNELGLVFRDQGKWAEATRCFESFIAESNEHAAHDDVAIGLLNLGEVHFFQGNLSESEAKLRAALELMATDAFRIDLLLNLGLIRQIKGDFAAAKRYYQEALSLSTGIGRRFILAAIHYRLANLCQHEFDQAGAFQHLFAGIQVVEETRAPLREEGLKISLLGRWQQLYEEMVLLLVSQQRLGEAFHYVERARSRAFLDMLTTSAATKAVEEIEISTSEITTEEITTEEPLTLAELQAQLPANTALVEFFATGLPGAMAPLLANIPQTAAYLREYLLPPEEVLAFIVTSESVQLVELDANVPQIAAQHFHRGDGRLRGIQPVPGQPLRPLHRWHDLAAQLLLPLQRALEGREHLFFVPHGVMHYLPLHALTAIEELTGVADTTVSYAPSASLLFKRPTPTVSSGKRNTLAIGVNGADLLHAEAEAAWLAARLDGEPLLGPAATHAAVSLALTRYAVIHFSCHGHFRRRNPLESALTLADGELTAIDLMGIGGLSAELVTLSACDTGLNQLHPGDELMGLTRAFLGSGVRSLLVTLWPVYEIPTRIFMEHFYTLWQEGASKAGALVAAQQYLKLMDNSGLQKHLVEYGLEPSLIAETVSHFSAMLPGSHPFAHPYYWGAFLLIGEPG